jgi:hypothetical protein
MVGQPFPACAAHFIYYYALKFSLLAQIFQWLFCLNRSRIELTAETRRASKERLNKKYSELCELCASVVNIYLFISFFGCSSAALVNLFSSYLRFDFPLFLKKTPGFVDIFSDVQIAARPPAYVSDRRRAQAGKNYALDTILLLEIAYFRRPGIT